MADRLTSFLTVLVIVLWLVVMTYGCRKTLKDIAAGIIKIIKINVGRDYYAAYQRSNKLVKQMKECV